MIVRVLKDNSVIKLHNIENEKAFMEINSTGGFMSIDKLPASASGKWIFQNNEIVSNAEADLEIKNNMYKQERLLEYPPIEEYIDGIVKGDNQQVQNYIDACNAIKAKYPKGDN
jgi:hypothetical protein